MTFGAPEWFWAAAILPLFCALHAWNERRSAALLQKMIALRLAPGLAGSVSRARRLARFACFLAGLALVIAALARPRLGFTLEKVPSRGRDVLIAVDTSKSMLTGDIQPSRLVRAKLAAEDLVRLLPGDRTGLVAFAGSAFLEAPLTIDYGAVLDSIHELDVNTIPLGGTNIAEAIQLAAQAFGKGESQSDCLILFTDGEELDGSVLDAARQAASKFRIFTVGVGTAAGAVIPAPAENGGTDFVRDENGQVVRSRLDETRLREVARITGGSYTHLQNGPADMKRIVDEGLGVLKEQDRDAKLSRRPKERYQWPLAAGLFFLCCSLLIGERRKRRKDALLAAAACILLLPRPAHSANPGIDLYEQKDFQGALQDFQRQGQKHPDSEELQFDQGAAAYQLGDYENAIAAFGKALTTRKPGLREKSEYNLGNALYQRAAPEQRPKDGRIADLKNAIQHYGEAIKADPKDADAIYNRELAEKKLKELLQPPPSPTPTPTPTPTPSPSPSPSPTPKPKPKPSPSPSPKDQKKQDKDKQDKQDKQDKGDRQPTPQKGQSTPSPTPGNSSPSPSPGNDRQDKGEPTPTPQAPQPSGGNNGRQPQPTPAPEGEPTPASPGGMTPAQAANLLDAMKGEDARYPLNEQKHPPTVLRDW